MAAFASSYIKTVAATVTRNADAATMTGTNFSSWANVAEGTMFASFIARLGIDQQVFGLGASAVSDGVRLRKNSLNTYNFVVREPTARDLVLTPSPVLTEGQTINIVGAYASNSLALSAGGQAAVTGATYNLVSLTQAFIGGSVAAGASFNGHIRKLAYYPSRLSNAQLAALTTV